MWVSNLTEGTPWSNLPVSRPFYLLANLIWKRTKPCSDHYVVERHTRGMQHKHTHRRTGKVSAVLIGAVEAEAFSCGADGVTSEAGTGVTLDAERRAMAWWWQTTHEQYNTVCWGCNAMLRVIGLPPKSWWFKSSVEKTQSWPTLSRSCHDSVHTTLQPIKTLDWKGAITIIYTII